jgi:hypothetical protein
VTGTLAGPWTPGHSTALLGAPLLACNYHDIPPRNRRAVERRLRALAGLAASLDLDSDVAAAPDGALPGPRIVVGFYDSYRDAGLFGADLCDRLGIRAYFFPLFEPFDEPGTAALTDAELADIATVHEVGFHTASHRSVEELEEVGEDRLRAEVDEPIARITALAGRPPRVGAWRGGTRFDDRFAANRRVRDLGVRHWMSNWSVEVVPGAPAQERP